MMEPFDGPIKTLPKDFGDGWMSANASDLCRIMIAFTSLTAEELVKTIVQIHRGSGMVNSATVERALAIIEQKWES